MKNWENVYQRFVSFSLTLFDTGYRLQYNASKRCNELFYSYNHYSGNLSDPDEEPFVSCIIFSNRSECQGTQNVKFGIRDPPCHIENSHSARYSCGFSLTFNALFYNETLSLSWYITIFTLDMIKKHYDNTYKFWFILIKIFTIYW